MKRAHKILKFPFSCRKKHLTSAKHEYDKSSKNVAISKNCPASYNYVIKTPTNHINLMTSNIWPEKKVGKLLQRLVIVCYSLPSVLLTLLVGHHEEHLACKNWVNRCWCGYLCAERCRLLAYGPVDATAIPKPHQLLPHFYTQIGTSLPRLSQKRGHYTGVVVV